MSDILELYQEMILDHNRHPRHFHKLADADHHAEGYNPLCGDRIHLYLKMEGDLIADVSFEGSGCAISKASASLMTDAIKGTRRQDVETLFQQFQQMVTQPLAIAETSGLGKLAVFAGVREFPSRVKCATLAWHTLLAAFQNRKERISTEEETKRNGRNP